MSQKRVWRSQEAEKPKSKKIIRIKNNKSNRVQNN